LDAAEPVFHRFVANGVKRFGNSGGWGISILVVAHGAVSCLNDVRGRSEIEYVRIANVQIENFVSLLLDLIGEADKVANGVSEIVQALGGSDSAGLS
jgi:hypothetical protein